MSTTPEAQFAALVAGEPARPFVTYYDEATGERSELSVRSLANWVAKTHFLLTDELGLGLGDTAVIDLPPHWISVPILLGCLSAGLTLAATEPGAVAFVGPEATADADEVFAIAPDTAALGFRGAEPPGTTDYVLAVRPQADSWASVRRPAGPDDPCLPGRSRGEVAADREGLPDGARILTTRGWTGPADWATTLFAPLAAGGSVVYVRNTDDAQILDRRAAQERAVRLVGG